MHLRCLQNSSRIRKTYVSFFKTKFGIGQYGFIALVTDTEGNMIGLHSMK